jgi:hypothetical protein
MAQKCLNHANIDGALHPRRQYDDPGDQERFEYQGLRPTLSINRAQMIEAVPPTPEVIQP